MYRCDPQMVCGLQKCSWNRQNILLDISEVETPHTRIRIQNHQMLDIGLEILHTRTGKVGSDVPGAFLKKIQLEKLP